ncbi:MAG: hypothetical protein ACKOQ7_06665 [Actinomycetota bacterium]
MEQRKTQREVLDDLVDTGRISAEEAHDISSAPMWTFSVRELVGYLAGLIIAAGAVQIISVVFEDASKWAVVTALYAVTVVAGLVAVQLRSRGSWQKRLAEILEAAAIGSALGATGIILDHVEMRGEWIGFVLSGAASAWGLARTARSRFIGTVVMSWALPVFAIVVAQLIDDNSDWLSGVTMLVAAGVLLAAGNSPIGASFIARTIGSVYVIAGSATIGSGLDSPAHLIPIVTGALLFAAATTILAPEMLIAGAVCVVTGVVMTVSEWIEGDRARGLVIVATGLVMLGAVGWQMRRGVSRPMPGAPAV